MPAGDPISGKDGTVKLGTSELFQITNWKVSKKAGTSRFATNSSGGWKRTVAGTKEWSGSFEQKLDDANPIPFQLGDTVDLRLHIDGSDGEYYRGNAVIASIDGPDVDINDGKEMGYTVSFEGDGELLMTGTTLADVNEYEAP